MAANPLSTSSRGSAIVAHRWWALAAACFGLFMALLDVTIVNVALPTIGRDLHAGFSDLQWVINAYSIALAVFLVTVGRLGDLFGRKRLFMIGLGIFTLGSLLCALSGDISFAGLSHTNILLGARGLQGFGGSFMLPLSLAIISATFQGRERGVALGIWGGVTGLATAIGPVVGGVLVQDVSWQSIFLLNIPIGIIGIVLASWAISESRDERAPRTVDIFGLLTSAGFVLCLVLALVQGNDKGWGSTYILALFAGALVSVLAFVVGELRIEHPMADPRLFAIPSFAGSAIVAFMVSAGFLGLLFFLTLYMQNTLGFDALQAGVRFLALSGLIFVGAPLSGRLVGRFGPKPLLTAGSALLVLSALLMSRISASQFDQSQWLTLLPAYLVGGIGVGLVNPPISALAVGSVDQRLAGMAAGISGLCRQLGMAVGIAFLGAVLTSRYNTYVHDRITALAAPGLTPDLRGRIIGGARQAGDLAGSAGLQGAGGPAGSYARMSFFPAVSHIARSAFVDGMVDILHIASGFLVLGLIAGLVLVRNPKARHREEAAAVVAAA